MNPKTPPAPRAPRIRPTTGTRRVAALATAAVLFSTSLFASDHADPIDPFNRERLEGGITDLFFFPILADGKPAFPFPRKDGISLAMPDLSQRPALTSEQRSQIKGFAVILCVRRALTQTGSLRLEPYTYRISMDLHSTVSFEDTPEDRMAPAPPAGGGGYTPPAGTDAKAPKRPTGGEARARYGGSVANPEGISADVLIEFTLKNDATIREIRTQGLKNAQEIRRDGTFQPDQISAWAGVRDDPFIFPAFFGTNVVAMVMTIPTSAFPEGQEDWLIWGTSRKGSRQIDHVGRSLRTQNPRFDFLNKLPPREHKAAIMEEHEHPSLLRDIALRFNMQSIFAYRKWDFVPDVMVYTTRFGVGFPNGRLLTDDVAALLAQFGDTLLLELSHQHNNGGWPRRTTNDKDFLESFPYLAAPWPDGPEPPPPALTPASWYKLIGIAAVVLVFLALENWLFARWYYLKKLRQRYL
jgi:hypothetical protein